MMIKDGIEQAPIGVFDSGFGGLTILRDIRRVLPQYDYLFVGDNARAPYGTRSRELVYEFTLQAVKHLFKQGCHLIILACNTASAEALRTIQQQDLPTLAPDRRVLGVVRPTVEKVGELTRTGHIGVFGTPGTIASRSYNIEIVDLRFVDENNNNALDANEHAKLVFIMRNTGRDYVYDIAPVITVSGTKEIYLSPTAIVKELAPGKAVRYQSELIATKKLKNGSADFTIGFSDGDKIYTMRSFQLRTNRR